MKESAYKKSTLATCRMLLDTQLHVKSHAHSHRFGQVVDRFIRANGIQPVGGWGYHKTINHG